MTQKVKVRISTVSIRDGKNDKFVSFSIADEMAPGYDRLPEAELKSYSLSLELWEKFRAHTEGMGAKWNSKKDKNGKAYWSSSPRVVTFDVELKNSLTDSLKDLDRTTRSLTLSGTASNIAVRDQRPGNTINFD
jgi:hypothetical protein